jgi:hypothetical protein
MTTLRVKNWEHFQHYKDRKPPWIKLYRDLLDNQEWRALSDLAARLLVELWLLASESDAPGTVEDDSKALAWRLRYTCSVQKISDALQELADQGFIERASSVLAGCKHSAIPEGEGETKVEKRKRHVYSEAFEKFWKLYPRNIEKLAAYRAWKKHGCEEFVDKVMATLQLFVACPDWRKDGGQYVPYPQKWLNRGGWDDEPFKRVEKEDLI